MKVVTVRQIPRELARAIERRASSARTSVNKAVIGLLEEAVGLARKDGNRARHHDLDALAGSWTGEETAAFDRSLQAQRGIDPDVWK
jgi:hypothetical protein